MATTGKQVAHLWRDILHAVLNKKTCPKEFERVFIGGIESRPTEIHEDSRIYLPSRKIHHKKAKNYYLNSDVYFTEREAECMCLLLEKYTNEQVGMCLGLSARTVEFYIKNMREKTGCVSKSHLIQYVSQTQFVAALDFSAKELCAWLEKEYDE